MKLFEHPTKGIPPAAELIEEYKGRPIDPITITTKAMDAIPIPMAIFLGVDGSIFLALNQPNNPTMIGVRNTTKKGFIDWKISAENS